MQRRWQKSVNSLAAMLPAFFPSNFFFFQKTNFHSSWIIPICTNSLCAKLRPPSENTNCSLIQIPSFENGLLNFSFLQIGCNFRFVSNQNLIYFRVCGIMSRNIFTLLLLFIFPLNLTTLKFFVFHPTFP